MRPSPIRRLRSRLFRSSTSQVNGAYNTSSTIEEFGETARDSRITLRADTDRRYAKLAGYFEMDFFGTGLDLQPEPDHDLTTRVSAKPGAALSLRMVGRSPVVKCGI